MNNFLNKQNLPKIGLILLFVLLPIVLAFVYTKVTDKAPVSTPGDETFQLYLYCPTTIADFCAQGKAVVDKDGVYLGFGNTLPANTPIRASFNGKVTVSTITLPTTNEKLTVIYLDNEEGKVRAIYTFKGDVETANLPVSPNDYIKVGTEIGRISGNITAYNTSLIFQLVKGDPITGEKVLLTKDSFLIGN